VLSKTKLEVDIAGGSTAESVPPSDELEHVVLIAGSCSRGGLVAVAGTPPTRAAIVLWLHVTSFFKGKFGTRLVDVPRVESAGVSVRYDGRRDDLVHRAATMVYRADDVASGE